MNDADRIKRFLADGDANNKEILDNLIALRGEYRAKVTSEITNLRLYMTALVPCTCFPQMSECMARSGATLCALLCAEHGWEVKELMADIDMMFNARALVK